VITLPQEFIDNEAERVQIAAGSVILRRGDEPGAAYYLSSGRVALGVAGEDGLDHQLGEMSGPFWLEATSVVLGQPHVVDVVAQTDAVLLRVSMDHLRASVQALPATVRSVLHDIATSHRKQTELAVSRLAKDAEARCAEWLVRHAQSDSRGAVAVPLEQRKRTIAAQLGIAPETFSRVLRHLRERSLISGTGRVLQVLDLAALQALAGF
jgi:CRP-like cAMP-binding protein